MKSISLTSRLLLFCYFVSVVCLVTNTDNTRHDCKEIVPQTYTVVVRHPRSATRRSCLLFCLRYGVIRARVHRRRSPYVLHALRPTPPPRPARSLTLRQSSSNGVSRLAVHTVVHVRQFNIHAITVHCSLPLCEIVCILIQ